MKTIKELDDATIDKEFVLKSVFIYSDERFTPHVNTILRDIKGRKAIIVQGVQSLLKPLQVDDDGYKCAWAMIDILLVDEEFDYSDDSSVFDYHNIEGVISQTGEEE